MDIFAQCVSLVTPVVICISCSVWLVLMTQLCDSHWKWHQWSESWTENGQLLTPLELWSPWAIIKRIMVRSSQALRQSVKSTLRYDHNIGFVGFMNCVRIVHLIVIAWCLCYAQNIPAVQAHISEGDLYSHVISGDRIATCDKKTLFSFRGTLQAVCWLYVWNCILCSPYDDCSCCQLHKTFITDWQVLGSWYTTCELVHWDNICWSFDSATHTLAWQSWRSRKLKYDLYDIKWYHVLMHVLNMSMNSWW